MIQRLRPQTAWAMFLTILVLYTWAYSYLGAILILEKNTVRTTSPQSDFIDAVYQSESLSRTPGGKKASISSSFTHAFPQFPLVDQRLFQ